MTSDLQSSGSEWIPEVPLYCRKCKTYMGNPYHFAWDEIREKWQCREDDSWKEPTEPPTPVVAPAAAVKKPRKPAATTAARKSPTTKGVK